MSLTAVSTYFFFSIYCGKQNNEYPYYSWHMKTVKSTLSFLSLSLSTKFCERPWSHHYALSGNSVLDFNSLHHLKNAEVRTLHTALIRSLPSLGATKGSFLSCDVQFPLFRSGNAPLTHTQLAFGSQVSSCQMYSPNSLLHSIDCIRFCS